MSTAYKRYERYKDSGVGWIGKVPEHWRLLKINQLSRVKRGASPRPIDDPKYFNDSGEYSWVRISDVTSSKIYLEETEQKLSTLGANLSVKLLPGDLFVSICATVGKPCITKIKCCIHDGFVYFPDFNGNKKFLFYLFEAGELYKGLGKLGTQLNLNTDTIGNIIIGLPTINEQTAITNFLEKKTSEIDSLIADKERLIELLQEKRQAIISEAVTKGLDKNVKMKDSGTPWIGEVPEGWEVSNFRRYCTLQQGLQIAQTERFYDPGEGRYEYITIKSLHSGDEDNLKEYIENPSKRVICYKDEVLLARTGATGEVITGCEGVFHNNFFKINFDRNKIVKEYLVIYLSQRIIKSHFQLVAGTTTIPDLNHGDFLDTPFIVPPLEEQDSIIKKVKNDLTRVDEVIEISKLQVDRFKEYRQVLISEAVTGKIIV